MTVIRLTRMGRKKQPFYRIAVGCGLTQVEINRMIKQFKNAGKMAKRFSGKNGMKDLQSMMGQMGGGAGAIPR